MTPRTGGASNTGRALLPQTGAISPAPSSASPRSTKACFCVRGNYASEEAIAQYKDSGGKASSSFLKVFPRHQGAGRRWSVYAGTTEGR